MIAVVNGARVSVASPATAMDVLAAAQFRAEPHVYRLELAQPDRTRLLGDLGLFWEGDDELPEVDAGPLMLWALVNGPAMDMDRARLRLWQADYGG